jgi:hypothetical protein
MTFILKFVQIFWEAESKTGLEMQKIQWAMTDNKRKRELEETEGASTAAQG